MKGTLARFINRLARQQPGPILDPLSVLLARRAQRVCNRSADAAKRYEARHLALARGRK